MNKNRGLKNRTAFSNSLDNNLYEKLVTLSKSTDIPISKLLDKAVKSLLDSYGEK